MKNNQILKNFLIMFVCYLIDSVINYFIFCFHKKIQLFKSCLLCGISFDICIL
mgnify:CR=1 FL=1